jgi:EsV-1-7 cysteine-rich motif
MSQRRKSATGRPKYTRILNRCQDPACTGVEASYGFEEEQKRVRCFKHKLDGMKLISRRACEEPACDAAAGFGWPGTQVSIALVLRTVNSNETRIYNILSYITCCGLTSADALRCLQTNITGAPLLLYTQAGWNDRRPRGSRNL